jgi:hypothetical protein
MDAGLVLVQERRVTLLEVGAVAQDDLRDGGGSVRGQDGSAETVTHQPGQVPVWSRWAWLTMTASMLAGSTASGPS